MDSLAPLILLRKDLWAAYVTPTNILSVLAYDNAADSFSMSHPGGLSIFTRRDKGLYVCNFGYPHVFVSTVSKIESRYTKREIKEARIARDFQRRLASPPDTKSTEIRALNEGTIQNTTVTAEHVRRATSIYGPTLESIYGRTTWKEGIPIPTNIHHRVTDMQTMYIDIFFACTLPYLITKVQPLGHMMTSSLPERSANAIRKAFLQQGIRISALLSDNEQGIDSLSLQFGSANIVLQAGPSMHVPQVKRAVRTVKEDTQGLLHTLRYDCPLVIFSHLPGYVASKMSIFKSSTRPTDITAFQILYGRPFNAKVDGHLEFGSYCQISGAGKVFTANHFTVLPMTDLVVFTQRADPRSTYYCHS